MLECLRWTAASEFCSCIASICRDVCMSSTPKVYCTLKNCIQILSATIRVRTHILKCIAHSKIAYRYCQRQSEFAHIYTQFSDTWWKRFSLCRIIVVLTDLWITYVAIDVLVRSSMRSAAKCITQCDLYDSVNLAKLQCKLCCRIIPECVHGSVSI
jgi:hypothetical protein